MKLLRFLAVVLGVYGGLTAAVRSEWVTPISYTGYLGTNQSNVLSGVYIITEDVTPDGLHSADFFNAEGLLYTQFNGPVKDNQQQPITKQTNNQGGQWQRAVYFIGDFITNSVDPVTGNKTPLMARQYYVIAR